jgi:hypothetical protein
VGDALVGDFVGALVGDFVVGALVGYFVGGVALVGAFVGGVSMGDAVRNSVGVNVATCVEANMGMYVGNPVGRSVGLSVGDFVGGLVGGEFTHTLFRQLPPKQSSDFKQPSELPLPDELRLRYTVFSASSVPRRKMCIIHPEDTLSASTNVAKTSASVTTLLPVAVLM